MENFDIDIIDEMIYEVSKQVIDAFFDNLKEEIKKCYENAKKKDECIKIISEQEKYQLIVEALKMKIEIACNEYVNELIEKIYEEKAKEEKGITFYITF